MSLGALLDPIARDPAECVLKLERIELEELYPFLDEVVVESSRGRADVCTLRFQSTRDEGGRWEVQDHPDLRPWSRLEVAARFGRTTEPIFAGLIKKVTPRYPSARGRATVEVLAQDETLLLDRESAIRLRSTIDEPRSDKEIITEIVGEISQLSLDPASGDGLRSESLLQSGTAAAFIRDRADANGYEFFVRDGSLYFGPPRLQERTRPPIMVYAGPATNCIELEVEFDGHRPDAVRLYEEDEAEPIVLESDLPKLGDRSVRSDGSGLPPHILTLRPPGRTPTDRNTAARAKANECVWKLRAKGELDGSQYGHVLRTYELVPVDGVGETYGGIWYVDSVHHSFSAKGYRQRFTLIRNATGDGALG